MAHEAAGSAEPAAEPGSPTAQTRKVPSTGHITEPKIGCVPGCESNRVSNRTLKQTSAPKPNPLPRRESGRMSNHAPECEPNLMSECEPKRRFEHNPRRKPNRGLKRTSADKPRHPILRNARMLGNILRHTGFVRVTVIFGVLFLFCSLMV